jgi:hypothetical protein
MMGAARVISPLQRVTASPLVHTVWRDPKSRSAPIARRCWRIANLDPDAARASLVGAVHPLGKDALAAQSAGVREDKGRLGDVFVEQDASFGIVQKASQRVLAVEEWEIAQILAVTLNEVTGIVGGLRRCSSSNRDKPSGPPDRRMPSIEVCFLRGRYSVGHRHADEIAGGPGFLDQAVRLLLVYIAARDAHPVHPARAARTGTVDDHGVMRIKEMGDIRHACLRHKARTQESISCPRVAAGGVDAVSNDERASTRSCSPIWR